MVNKSITLAALTFAFSFNTQASFIELNSGDFAYTSDGEGGGRGISFQVSSSFSIDSVGIYGDLLNNSFDVLIYSSTDGHQINTILASATAVVGGTGNGWNDIAINYTFNASDFYVINWQPTSISNWAWTLDFYNDSSLPAVVGPVTLIDGISGNDTSMNFGNILHPNIRVNVNTVPIPAAVWLFGSGLIGLIGIARRKKA